MLLFENMQLVILISVSSIDTEQTYHKYGIFLESSTRKRYWNWR